MKALVFKGKRQLTWCDWNDPVPGPGEALIAVRAVGICGSDIHGFTGESGRRIPPMIMGHEAAGEIIKLGPGVSTDWLGVKAVINPILNCGECQQCQLGYTHRCLKRRFIGGNIDGAMAERIAIPVKNLHFLPEGLGYKKATLTEPYAVGLHAANIAGDLKGKTVLVVGCGPIGLLTLVAAKGAGAKLALATDIQAYRRVLAEQFGAEAVLDPTTDEIPRSIHEIMNLDGVDIAFDAVGIQKTFDQALNSLKQGGILVALGGWQTLKLNFSSLVTFELSLRGTFNYGNEFEQALHLLGEDVYGLEQIITHSFPLSEGAQVFDWLMQQEFGVGKVILTGED